MHLKSQTLSGCFGGLSFLFKSYFSQNLSGRHAAVSESEFFLRKRHIGMGIQFYHAVVYFQPLRVCENRRPDARLMYASGIFYDIFERAELRNKLRSGFRSYLVGAADIVGAVARHRLEIGISARLYAVFIAHRLLCENHRPLPRYRSTDTFSDISWKKSLSKDEITTLLSPPYLQAYEAAISSASQPAASA